MPKHTTFVYPDANVFLECLHLEELPWRDVAPDADTLSLIITMAAVSEIDRFAYSDSQAKQQRARDFKALVRKIREAQNGAYCLFADCDVQLNRKPAPEWRDSLRRDDADDQLLAEVLGHERDSPRKVLVSHDTVIALKAEHHGLRVYEVPEDWIRPRDADRVKMRLRSLEEKVASLAALQPKMDLWFESADETRTVLLEGPGLVERTVAEVLLAQLVEIERKRLVLSPQPQRLLDNDQIAGYHGALDEYLGDDFPRYVQRYASLLANRMALLSATFCLKNTGGTPAEGLELEIRGSGGLILFHEEPDWEPSRPKPPKRPPPRRAIEAAPPLPYSRSLLPDLPVPYRSEPPPPRDPRSFYWKERGGSSYDGRPVPLRLSCERFMHSGEVDETALFIAPAVGCAGGEITASVSAANMPKYEESRLSVRLREPASSEVFITELRERLFPAVASKVLDK